MYNLHEKLNIVHFDIKANNFLYLNENGKLPTLYLADFGFSKEILPS